MRIAFVIDPIRLERPRATTLVLARTARARGHDVFLLEVDEMTCSADGRVGGRAHAVPEDPMPSTEALLEAVREADRPRPVVSSASLDVLWLRYNPAECGLDRRWAAQTGIRLAQLALRRDDILVLDHPDTLAWAESKLYLNHLPGRIRPHTLVTRDLETIDRFHREHGRIVLKPLGGYGGRGVVRVEPRDTNLHSLVDLLAADDFIIAQEYVPAAEHGDIRLFMMNGRPLADDDGRIAAIRRVSGEDDFRGNMTAGATARAVHVDATLFGLADAAGPALRRDGLFLAGLDIAGDRILEVNTMTPGGLYSASLHQERDFGRVVIRAVERKLERKRSGRAPANRVLAATD
ncbi:MAG: glutathione synthase [Gemmatimonadota bacterium]